MQLRPLSLFLAVSLCLGAWGAAAVHAESATPVPPKPADLDLERLQARRNADPAAVPDQVTVTPNAPAPRSPLALALLAARATYREERDALYAELSQTQEPARRLALQRELERVKLGAELTMLQIQLDHARATGNDAVAQELEKIAAAAQRWKDAGRPTSVQTGGPSQ